jgi:hypothetical protein
MKTLTRFGKLATLTKVTFFSAGQQGSTRVLVSKNPSCHSELPALQLLCILLSNIAAPRCAVLSSRGESLDFL